MTSPVIVSRIQNRRGTQTQFDGLTYTPGGPNSLYPQGYNGLNGYGSFPDFDSVNYPNVLLPGELAFCTDTFKVFIGNVNGAYTEIGSGSSSGDLTPVVTILPPTQPSGDPPIFSHIATLDYQVTPFFNMIYDVTDSILSDWNSTGTSFSKNGELKITAISGGPASLVDTAVEINTGGTFFSLQAVFNYPSIEIWYSHDHSTNLTFSTSSIRWLPF